MSKAINLLGQRFGRLVVIAEGGPYRNGSKYWLCQCDCGNKKDVASQALRNGNTMSCGCYQKEQVSKLKKDLTGLQFGFLVAIEPTKRRSNGAVVWKCKCLNCNNFTEVRQDSLQSGATQSCGCIKSRGEFKIGQILNELQIDFKKEKIFKELVSTSGGYLRFDFYFVYNNKEYVIEYQGEQHYRSDNNWGGLDREENDNHKKEYCKNNNIVFIEIPYWDYEELNKEYIERGINNG